MPIIPNRTREHWDPKADIAPVANVAFAPDPRVFDMYDENDVALCLEEFSTELAVYDFTPNVDVKALALESAKEIIKQRRELLESRQHELARQTTVVTPITKHRVQASDVSPKHTIKRPSRQFG